MLHSHVVFRRLEWELAWLRAMSEKLKGLADETGAKTFAVDAPLTLQPWRSFSSIPNAYLPSPTSSSTTPSSRVSGRLSDLDPAAVERSVAITAVGAFLVAQQAAKRMEPRRHGAIVFTGASAGVKGSLKSAPFAMGKFALRGLAQSAARELGRKAFTWPFHIDGGVRSASRPDRPDQPGRHTGPGCDCANIY